MNEDSVNKKFAWFYYLLAFIAICVIAALITNPPQTTASVPKQSPVSVKGKPIFASLYDGGYKAGERIWLNMLKAGADPNEHLPLTAEVRRFVTELYSRMPANIRKRYDLSKEHLFFTPVIVAIQNGYMFLLQELIQSGADLNPDISELLDPPLHIAIRMQNPQMVKLLLAYGADPNKTTPIGNSISTAAVNWKSRRDTLIQSYKETLCGASVDFDAFLTNAINKVSKVADGNIGLESHQILKLLLDYEARVDIVNSNGFYPIMSALKAKNYDAVIILLPHYDNLDEVSFTFDGLKIPFPFMVARNGIPLIMKAVLSKEPQWCNYHLDNGDSLSDWANNQEMKELIESFGKCY